MTFRSEFERITAALDAHPDIELFGSKLGEPGDKAAIEALMNSVGCTPDPAIVDFYTAHDGAYLEWGLKGREYERVGEGGWPDYGTPPGVINMLTARDVFSADWQSEYTINQTIGDETWNLAYGKPEPTERSPNAVVVDYFSIYYHTDLLLGPEPLLVVASDHGADLSCSDLMTFSQYLDLVIAQFGWNPYKAVGIGWSRPAQRLSAIPTLTLDEIVAKIRAEDAEHE